MSHSPFSRRWDDLWSLPGALDVVVSLLDDDTPAGSYARGAHVVASTNVDWRETPTEHVFKVDLPGLKKEQVTVQVEGNRTLSIAGERPKEEVHKTDTWHRAERGSGKFTRKFRLPNNANLEQIKANVEDGVLTVLVSKKEKKKPETRTIEITGQDGISGQEMVIHHGETTPSNGHPAPMQAGDTDATSLAQGSAESSEHH